MARTVRRVGLAQIPARHGRTQRSRALCEDFLTAILRELKTPIIIHQPSYSMLGRWIEDGLLREECLAALGNLRFGDEELARIDRHAVEDHLNIWAASSQQG